MKASVPAMASRAKCQRKFFTPTALSRDPVGALEYLLSKFDRHDCVEVLEEEALRVVTILKPFLRCSVEARGEALCLNSSRDGFLPTCNSRNVPDGKWFQQ
jgi:hypothetical protein